MTLSEWSYTAIVVAAVGYLVATPVLAVVGCAVGMAVTRVVCGANR